MWLAFRPPVPCSPQFKESGNEEVFCTDAGPVPHGHDEHPHRVNIDQEGLRRCRTEGRRGPAHAGGHRDDDLLRLERVMRRRVQKRKLPLLQEPSEVRQATAPQRQGLTHSGLCLRVGP